MRPSHRLFWRIPLLLLLGVFSLSVSIAVNEKQYGLAGCAAILAFAAGLLELVLSGRHGRLLTDNRLAPRTFNRLLRPETSASVRDRIVQLRDQLGLQHTTTISMTVHLAVRRTDCVDCQIAWSLVQIIDYVGHRNSGRARVTPDVKGIIGRCFRTATPHSVNFHNPQEYTRLMSREFGYYPDESSFHDTEGRSYLCCPIGQDGTPLAVFYIYSTQEDIFPDNAINYATGYREAKACLSCWTAV